MFLAERDKTMDLIRTLEDDAEVVYASDEEDSEGEAPQPIKKSQVRPGERMKLMQHLTGCFSKVQCKFDFHDVYVRIGYLPITSFV